MKTHPSLKNVNVPLLCKIRDRIAARPRQFQMKSYFSDYCSTGGAPSHCGTAACIAGWAVVFGGRAKNPTLAHAMYGPLNVDVATDARRLLGLGEVASWCLFLVTYWPRKFRAKWLRVRTPTAAAKVAVARINHFIKTGH